jgi:hypothetical protein
MICQPLSVKFKIILPALVLLGSQAFSQTKNNISLVYGAASNIVDIHGAIGDFGYSPESGTNFGLSYTHYLSKHFSLETGLLYSKADVLLSTIQGPRGEFFYNGDVKMISIPVYAKFTFLKYVFLQGGILLDHQTNYSRNGVINDESGVGLEMGIGGKYSFGPVSVFVNPFLAKHGTPGSNNLLEAGAKFGLGFDF